MWLLWAVVAGASDRATAERALAADPTSAARWADLAAATDDPREALPLLREALRLDPVDVGTLVLLARTSATLLDPTEARAALDRAVAVAPGDRRVRLAVAELRSDGALAREVLAAFPGDPEAALLVARLVPEDGVAALASVTEPNRQVLVARLELDLRAGDLADAELAASALRALSPADLDWFEPWLACLRTGTADPEQVGAFFDARRRAIANPTGDAGLDITGAEQCPAALALRATTTSASAGGDPVGDLRAAVALAPADAALAGRLGEALLAAGRPEEARPWLEQAAAERPWEPPLALASALHQLGDDRGARALLAEPRFADDPSVALLRADLATSQVDALEILVAAAERTRDPQVLQRARTLGEALGTPVARPSLPPIGAGVEEVVVTGTKISDIRLEALISKLLEQGYGPPTVKANGDVFFEAVDVQHPWVALHPDGQFDVQRAGYVPLENPITLDEVLGNQVVRVDAPFISERKLKGQRMRVMDEIIAEVRAWREALCAEGFEDRVLLEIPDSLDRVWRDGLALTGDTALETPEERRQAILQWWATRTCTPEGEQVRTVIARYLELEVQASPWPVTAAELVATNSGRACPGELVLSP